MFSNPLKQIAEEYLSTTDSKVRETTQRQLIRAGSSAIPPLIDALIVTLPKFNSASWGNKEIGAFVNAMEEFLGPYADRMRQEINATPDRQGDGMSMAQATLSREACSHVWQVISQIGESGVRALFTLINGRDKRVRLATMLALSTEENPNRFILNSLITSAPYQETFSSEIEMATGFLMLRMVAMSGDQRASSVLKEYGQKAGMSGSELADALIDQGILLLAK